MLSGRQNHKTPFHSERSSTFIELDAVLDVRVYPLQLVQNLPAALVFLVLVLLRGSVVLLPILVSVRENHRADASVRPAFGLEAALHTREVREDEVALVERLEHTARTPRERVSE